MPDDFPVCKKHNKPKQIMKGKRNNHFIGCPDCVAEKGGGAPPAKKETQNNPPPPPPPGGDSKKKKGFWW
jgi:ssDNA-binding Zn-finger/Zn-ribbon topoisomerase 1